MKQDGLSLDQAPPLSIPASFFLTGAVFLGLAGLLALWLGEGLIQSHWLGATIGWVHLLTLGLLGQIMLGALYQMTPVVAGVPVPRVGLARVVNLATAAGLALLVGGLLTGRPPLVFAATVALGGGMLCFILPVGWALLRSPANTETVWGMRLALLCLILTAGMGIWMAQGHAGSLFPGARPVWLRGHITVGVLGWVGGLIMGVSWQVVPMFYVARPVPIGLQRACLAGLGLGVLGVAGAILFSRPGVPMGSSVLLDVTGIIAALAVWLLHPLSTLWSISRRKRKRRDGSVRFWQAGMTAGVATLIAAALAWATASPPLLMLWGWLALWGWAALTMHGMLYRIVPFLVWFHRMSPLLGVLKVPAMRQLLPDRRVHYALYAHLLTLALGGLAVVTGRDWMIRLTAACLVGVAVTLAANLITVLRTFPPEAPPK